MSWRSKIFESKIAVSAYALVTDQDIWLRHAMGMLDEVPNRHAPIRVLDIGCGPGTSTRALKGALNPEDEIVGLDISKSMIARAARRNIGTASEKTIPYAVGDASELPFPDEIFDVVIGHSFLYLVPDRRRVLRELHRVLSPAGCLVFLEPNRHSSLFRSGIVGTRAWRTILENPRSSILFAASMVGWRVASRVAGRLSREEINMLFREAGYESIRVEERFGGLGLLCVGRVPD